MIQAQLKLRINSSQEKMLNEWLWILTGVHNWAARKIEQDAKGGVFYSEFSFKGLLAHHGKKIGIPSHTLQGMLGQVHTAWSRCAWKKLGGKPRLKGMRNKLNSIPFPDPLHTPPNARIQLPGIGVVRFHKQDIPAGDIKRGRIIRRASGWYLSLFIDADRKPIARHSFGTVGIDPGFKSLLALSSGEKIDHPRELQNSLDRLGRAQRGTNRRLVARLHERIKNERKDRNHKLSLRLVRENTVIVFSKDNINGIAKTLGKSVASSGHAQLRSMLSYKSHAGGTKYIEVASHNSTKTCSACGSLSGPTGWSGLAVRHWTCGCGAIHDRDTNAAMVTLMSGLEQPTLQSNAFRNPRQFAGRLNTLPMTLRALA